MRFSPERLFPGCRDCIGGCPAGQYFLQTKEGDAMRIPKHIGIIPDGNRRWASQAGLEKKDGYVHG